MYTDYGVLSYDIFARVHTKKMLSEQIEINIFHHTWPIDVF